MKKRNYLIIWALIIIPTILFFWSYKHKQNAQKEGAKSGFVTPIR